MKRKSQSFHDHNHVMYINFKWSWMFSVIVCLATFLLQTASFLQAMLSTFDASPYKIQCSAGSDQETKKKKKKKKKQESHSVADTWAVVSTCQNSGSQNEPITAVKKAAHHRRTSFFVFLFHRLSRPKSTSSPEEDKQYAMETSRSTLSDDIVRKMIIL